MKNETKEHNLWLGAALLWMLFIWSNSLQTAAESSQQSRGVLELLLPMLSWTGLSEELCHTLIRKAAHMAEFALLGFFWAMALRPARGAEGSGKRVRLGWALTFCVLIALTDETIQRFVPGRSGEIWDVCIDGLGSVIGCLAISRRNKR